VQGQASTGQLQERTSNHGVEDLYSNLPSASTFVRKRTDEISPHWEGRTRNPSGCPKYLWLEEVFDSQLIVIHCSYFSALSLDGLNGFL
jgi:hypothetical protein